MPPVWEDRGQDHDAEALSLVDWWVTAGLDTLVDDRPRDWLAAGHAPAAVATPASADAAQPEQFATIAALHAHLAAADLPQAGPPARRIAPSGDPQAALAVILDMPDADDVAAGALLSGRVGTLFDRMLAAIGQRRDGVYLAPLCPGCPPGSRIDDVAMASLGTTMRLHLSLTAAKAVLLIGDTVSRALLGMDCSSARGRTHDLNHDSGTVVAIATLHPRTLLRQPSLKAESWKDLQMLAKALR